MPFDPSEPRDQKGRWTSIGENAKRVGGIILKAGAIIGSGALAGVALAVASREADAAANAHVLRKADILKRQNNKVARQRTHHPRDFPHTAMLAEQRQMKNPGVITPEAKAALDRELTRNKMLSQPPGAPKPPEWRGLATSFVAGGVMGSQLKKFEGAGDPWKPPTEPPATTHAGNLEPYRPAMKNTRAVPIRRTTEFPNTRFTAQTVVRHKLPKG